MAIKSSLSIHNAKHVTIFSSRSLVSIMIGLLLLTVAGCRTPQTREPGQPGSGPVPGPVTGPVPPSPTPSQPPTPLPPAPTSRSRAKVAVILGPGGAKSFAHVGVLKAFQQQRIPIDKIVGLEWGALIAGLYSSKGQINDVEWKLYKMEQKGLPRPRGFFSKRLGQDSIKNMEGYFSEAFGNESIGSGKIDFACPSRSIWTGVVAWQSRGSLKDAMKRCVPFPPLFKAQGTFIGGASQAVEAIDWLRKDGYNLIIVVNVLGSAMPVAQDSLPDQLDYVILWQEVKRALMESSRYNVEFVNVDTSSIPMVQFESKKELIHMGESAGQRTAGGLVNKYGL